MLKLTCLINTLNRWSNSHTYSVADCLISFNTMMHCDSDLDFLNFHTNAFLISSIEAVELDTKYFVYHASALSHSVMTRRAFFTSSSVIYLTFYTASATNQNWSGSSDPSPLKIGTLMSLTIFLLKGLGGGGGGGGVGDLWGGGGGWGARGVDGWGNPKTPWIFSSPNFDAPSIWEGGYCEVAGLLPSSSLSDPPNKGL